MSRGENLEYLNKLGERLLEHRYRYYVLDCPVLSDGEYDILEKTYEALAVELGVEATASNMVGWDYKKEGALAAKDRVDSKTDSHSLWLKEMFPVWNKLGKPKSWERLIPYLYYIKEEE